MSVSERKRLANKRNAQKSTGPKTETGKRASAANAITHGIFVRQVLTALNPEEESLAAERRLQLRKIWHPKGIAELSLVDKILAEEIRLMRIYRYEAGIVYLQKMDRQAAVPEERALLSELSYSALPLLEARVHLTTSSLGLKVILDTVQRTREELANIGTVDPKLLEMLRRQLGEEHDLFRALAAVAKTGCDLSESASEFEIDQVYEATLAQLHELFHSVQRCELANDLAELSANSLPKGYELERIVRCHQEVKGSIRRLEHNLEQLQSKRRERRQEFREVE